MFKGLRLTADLPPVWLAGFAVLCWALGRIAPLWRFEADGPGAALIVAGLALVLWSAWYFFRHDTPIEPGNRPEALIEGGPFRLNRNPIYSGLVLILLGFALRQGALGALLPVPFYPMLLTRRFILPEEAALRGAFGAKAEAFFARTRRW